MDWQHIDDHAFGRCDFDDLSPLEQDIARVWEFQTLFEMEGFTHFFSTHYGEDVSRLIAFMERFGASNVDPIRRVASVVRSSVPSWDPDDVDGFFCDVSDDVDAQIRKWGDEYYAGVEAMWNELDNYLEKEGFPRRPTI